MHFQWNSKNRKFMFILICYFQVFWKQEFENSKPHLNTTLWDIQKSVKYFSKISSNIITVPKLKTVVILLLHGNRWVILHKSNINLNWKKHTSTEN